jgi:hypothetical protein
MYIFNFFWSLLFICLFVISFFLGKISKIFESIPDTKIVFEDNGLGEGNLPSANFPQNTVNKNGYLIFASKQGKKYYFLWCKSNIKESNKIYFKSEEDAKKRGLTLASNCK